MGETIYLQAKINAIIRRSNRLTFVIFLTIIICLITVAFNLSYNYIKGIDIIWLDFPGKDQGIIAILIQSVILAPILETFLCQSLPYRMLNKVKYLNERSYLILLISALFFGLTHFYSLFYIIYATLAGLVFMYGYMIRMKTDNKTYYLIAISHALVNLIVFIRNQSVI
jgi:hypothetical protein